MQRIPQHLSALVECPGYDAFKGWRISLEPGFSQSGQLYDSGSDLWLWCERFGRQYHGNAGVTAPLGKD